MSRPLAILFAIVSVAWPFPLSAQQTPQAGATERAERFVKSAFEHGVPYSEARALGTEALPALRGWLRNDEYRPYWGTIISTIGFLGEPADFDILREFVVNRFSGEIDEATFNGMLASLYAIGHIAPRSEPAMAFLKSGTAPSSYGALRWTYRSYDGTRRGLLLSKFAINSLSLTGKPEAEQVLLELEKSPHHERQLSNIREGLRRVREIKRRGRGAYIEAVERGEVK